VIVTRPFESVVALPDLASVTSAPVGEGQVGVVGMPGSVDVLPPLDGAPPDPIVAPPFDVPPLETPELPADPPFDPPAPESPPLEVEPAVEPPFGAPDGPAPPLGAPATPPLPAFAAPPPPPLEDVATEPPVPFGTVVGRPSPELSSFDVEEQPMRTQTIETRAVNMWTRMTVPWSCVA
jgi:hypothetical protein